MTEKKSATATTPATELPKNPNNLYVILALCAAGIGVGIHLVMHKLNILYTKGYTSSCNLGGALNCDAVNMSGMSELGPEGHKLPISLLAVPTYLTIAYCAWLVLRAIKSQDATLRQIGSRALDVMAGIGLLTSAFSVWLAYYSTVHVQAYCLYCISLYFVSFAVTWLSITTGSGTVAHAVSRAFAHLVSFAEPVAVALGVTVIGLGISIFAYDHKKAAMEAGRLEREKAGIEETLGLGKPAEAQAAKPTEQANHPADSASAGSAPRPMPSVEGLKDLGNGVKVGGKMTPEDGWTFALFPFDEGIDYAYGNPDAKVTVVKISDYECPYCKFLALSMEPLKAKYKDKVRFIMKQFPMNPACNRYMAGYDKHPNACNASLAGVCAGKQGKFWEMHDKLYAEQPKLAPEDNHKYAQDLGLDVAKFDSCVKDPATMALIKKEIEEAHVAGINGAPRTYINGRLVTGSATTNILEYIITKTLENPNVQPVANVPVAAKPDGSHMIAGKTAKGAFWIDPYEGSLSKDGKALSLPDVDPAEVSWTDADAACKKAGKRLCTEEEWVSVCTGTPAVDNNNNNQFADDDVEGQMYPYGAFYEAGNCRDQEDKYKGKSGKTGSMDKCRTASGVFDLAGNIGEWSGITKETAGLMGGHNSSGERAACNQRSASFGAGNRNQTTGFRCCADSDVQTKADASQVAESGGDLLNKPVPAFSAKDTTGKEINTSNWKGKVTLINFFASWCGPCKKEFPELVNLEKEHRAKGFQVVSIGVDREAGKSVEFAKGFEAGWSVIEDAESELMGKFGVYSMPATFIIDRQGNIKFMDTGFKPEEQASKLRSAIQGLL